MVDQDKHVLALQVAITSDMRPYIGEIGPRSFAAERLQERSLRKLVPTTPAAVKATEETALTTFLSMNARSAEWAWKQTQLSDELFDNELKYAFWRLLSGYTLGSNYLDACDLGPGASVGAKSNDLYTKLFGCTLTGTSSGLYMRYVASLQMNPTRLAAEKQRRRDYGPFEVVRGSSVSFVPKDFRTARVICTEPILNMLAQKAIGAYLESKLSQIYKINLSYQPAINNRLSKESSISHKMATLDLRSASDCISVAFAKWAFPADFVRCLLDARCSEAKLPNGEWVKLHMVSGMGNAFTFPLQTLIFATFVRTAYRLLDIDSVVSVFGDDIIVDERARALVVEQLERHGFIINTDKSFFGACDFRESCGGDWYQGVAVKPVYIKHLVSQEDFVSAFNRLRLWSIQHSIPMFRTLRLLRSWIEKPCYQPFGTAVGEGLMCTLQQAATRKAVQLDLEYGEISAVFKYKYRCKVAVKTYITDGSNPDGLVMFACSGRALPGGRDLLPEKSEKVKRFTSVLKTGSTSVWPSGLETAQALYK